MPQPQWLTVPWLGSTRGVLKFGGKPLPLIGTNMNYEDLNDGVSWFVENITKSKRRIHGIKPYIYQEESAFIFEDSEPRTVRLTTRFDESSGLAFSQKVARLSQAGEQWLTMDNLTGLSCKFVSEGNPVLVTGGISPYMFKTDLEFISAASYALDLSPVTVAPFAVVGSSGAGTATSFNTTYDGSVRARPVFTFTIPVGNTATISQIKLQNTLTGRILTVNFSPVLPASTARVITIDTGTWQISDGAGTLYDPIGSLPVLAPPAGTVNTWSFTVVSNIGTTGLTLGYSYYNRWEF